MSMVAARRTSPGFTPYFLAAARYVEVGANE
jgi:hypothetical protein